MQMQNSVLRGGRCKRKLLLSLTPNRGGFAHLQPFRFLCTRTESVYLSSRGTLLRRSPKDSPLSPRECVGKIFPVFFLFNLRHSLSGLLSVTLTVCNMQKLILLFHATHFFDTRQAHTIHYSTLASSAGPMLLFASEHLRSHGTERTHTLLNICFIYFLTFFRRLL